MCWGRGGGVPILRMLVTYTCVYGVGMVVYVLFVAVSSLGSEYRNMVKWA